MVKVSCRNCGVHCCGMIPGLTPVLTPEESLRFSDRAVAYEADGVRMWRMAKKPSGTCVFLHDEMMHCLAYAQRPLECQLYPFLLDFSGEAPRVRLDRRHCPAIPTMMADEDAISRRVASTPFPPDWIRGYLATTDC